MRRPSCQASPPSASRRHSRSSQRGRGVAGQRQRRGQPVAQVDDVKQQRPQRAAPLVPRLGPRAIQFLLQGGVAGLQRIEDAAELVQRLLHQARLRAHLAAQPGHLDEDGEQVGRLPRILRRLPAPAQRCRARH